MDGYLGKEHKWEKVFLEEQWEGKEFEVDKEFLEEMEEALSQPTPQ